MNKSFQVIPTTKRETIIKKWNKKLSRIKKRRIDRKNKIDDNMKLLLNRTKLKKKKQNKNFDKIKQLEILLVNIKYANDPNKLEIALKESKKNSSY